MRDIRPDLRERLESIARERARLDQMEAGIKALLNLEDRCDFPAPSNGSNHAAAEGSTPLARFLLRTLHQANKPISIGDFKAAAEKEHFDFGEKAPGRVLHRGLVGMAQGGTVAKAYGKWRLVEEDTK